MARFGWDHGSTTTLLFFPPFTKPWAVSLTNCLSSFFSTARHQCEDNEKPALWQRVMQGLFEPWSSVFGGRARTSSKFGFVYRIGILPLNMHSANNCCILESGSNLFEPWSGFFYMEDCRSKFWFVVRMGLKPAFWTCTPLTPTAASSTQSFASHHCSITNRW